MYIEQFKKTGTLLHVVPVLIPCGMYVFSVLNSLAKLGISRGTTPSLPIPVLSPAYRSTVFNKFVKTQLCCDTSFIWTPGGGNNGVKKLMKNSKYAWQKTLTKTNRSRLKYKYFLFRFETEISQPHASYSLLFELHVSSNQTCGLKDFSKALRRSGRVSDTRLEH